jgi:leucine dehydrogenase
MSEELLASTSTATMLFDEVSKMGHEQVVFCNDPDTGLKAIIGIHNTVLGPALGGTRMWPYNDENEALIDVLRLSRGMTFKAAISGLNLGGGKAVIIGDPKKLKNEALLRRFGKFVDSLGGKYITAEDVGMGEKDMEFIAMETEHITGLSKNLGGAGDPSPVTAYGTYMGMKASAKKVYGSDSLEGKVIAVQGVGHVGTSLVELLVKEKSNVLVSDIFEDKIAAVTKNFMVEVISPEEILETPMDIYAPCALGATLNSDTIPRLKAKIVAGAANNQLANEDIHGPMCQENGILYAPDFLINAGGVMNVYGELMGYSREMIFEKAEHIFDTTLSIFELAENEGVHTQLAAMKLAQNRIESVGKIKLPF